MWIQLFTIVSALAVCMSVAAVMVQRPTHRSLHG
jgi:hypothetical protein